MSILSNKEQLVIIVCGYCFTLAEKCGRVVINVIEKRRAT